jgi:CheY-like chemotaxis protein
MRRELTLGSLSTRYVNLPNMLAESVTWVGTMLSPVFAIVAVATCLFHSPFGRVKGGHGEVEQHNITPEKPHSVGVARNRYLLSMLNQSTRKQVPESNLDRASKRIASHEPGLKMAKPVLLSVDDDSDVLRAIERDLRSQYGAEYGVIGSDSPEGALDLLKQLKVRNDSVALLLADQRMPRMDGVEFLREAMQIFPGAKRTLLTAYADY